MGTIASQLGHCCLKLEDVAMLHALRSGVAGGSENDGGLPKIYHTQGAGYLAKPKSTLHAAFRGTQLAAGGTPYT
jgi:hypothetical protein